MKLPSWQNRRKIIFGALFYCGCMLIYLALQSESTPVRETLALGIVGLAGTIITGYLGFATWDDKNMKEQYLAHQNSNAVSPTDHDGSSGSLDDGSRMDSVEQLR
mgnify:CR=1 FL=1